MSSVHVYYEHCDANMKLQIDKIAEEVCPSGYLRVKGMDEMYTIAKTPSGSDNVFETPHIDGPFGFMPFTLIRCVYAIKGSPNVETIIHPRPGAHDGKRVTLDDGEHLMIDYNRDKHHVVYNGDNIERHVVKLHFVKEQKLCMVYAMLNTYWNTFARYIFEKSKTPKTFYQRILSNIINKTTVEFSNIY